MGVPRILLEAGGIYHIYNHAVGWDNIFREEENYRFFMNRLIPRISPVCEVMAFCLMPNHFHFVIRIKDKKELVIFLKDRMAALKAKRLKNNNREIEDHFLLDRLIIMEFGNFFNSYVQAFNKLYRRYGGLLKESFQRKIVISNIQLLTLICYVHNNPVAHGFTSAREKWKHSSYLDILSDKKSFVPKQDVLELFGGKENYIFLHDKFMGAGFDF